MSRTNTPEQRERHAAAMRAHRAAAAKPTAAPPVDREPRDTRPPAKAGIIAEAVAAAASALEPYAKARLWISSPASYAELRRFFVCLSDDERRRVLVAFVQDEGRRISHDRAASFNAEAG
ncbi:MAG TPA: hypothetical protein VK841_22440 [Polyangiaceae bacterium]|nr:hypothetical protein [Polyangiaceae bacterium]